MFKIFKYIFDTKEWDKIRNSKLKSKEREKLFNEYILKNGEQVTLQDYFNDNDRKKCWRTNVAYKCFGEPTNSFEKLAYGEIESYGNLMFCSMYDDFYEDFTESRTSWDEMFEYAKGLYYFINDLKDEIAKGIYTIK